jgi:hypothetical protein
MYSFDPYLLKKMVCLASTILLPPLDTREIFLSTLNFMVLQMVRNECVNFDKHVDIQVSYKILHLEIPKEAPILHIPPYFQTR